MTLIQEYQNGDHVGVWEAIRKMPNDVARRDQAVLDVATSTMERVAQNADLITNRLSKHGWRALGSDYSDLRTQPTDADQSIIDRVSKISGSPLPVSFGAFWQTVGGINWVWDYQSGENCPDFGFDIPFDEMDPLCIDPPQATTYQLDEWQSGEHHLMTGLSKGKFRLDLAPDALHKANISGGDAYAIYLPSPDSDPKFANERHNLSFVDYLRLAFEWAGFPDLEKHRDHPDVNGFVNEFSDGLLEF